MSGFITKNCLGNSALMVVVGLIIGIAFLVISGLLNIIVFSQFISNDAEARNYGMAVSGMELIAIVVFALCVIIIRNEINAEVVDANIAAINNAVNNVDESVDEVSDNAKEIVDV